MTVVYSVMRIVLPYQIEQRVVRQIKAVSGQVLSEYQGPDWIPPPIRDKCPFYDRVISVNLANNQRFKTELISELKSLRRFRDSLTTRLSRIRI